MKQLLTLFLVTFVLYAPSAAQRRNVSLSTAPAASKFGNTDGVTANQLKEHLTFIASDELEGRDTPSRGLDIAAMYIAQHLGTWGIKPAGDRGSYFQKFALKSSKIAPAATSVEFAGQAYEYGKDFLTSTVDANIADTPAVFAGYGWVIKSKNINPYEGISVKDKIVVVVNSLPKGVTNADLKGANGGDWISPVLYAQLNGAKAVITFPTFGNLANWDATRWNQSEKGIVQFGSQPSAIKIPSVTASPKMLASLFYREKFTASVLFNKTYAYEPLESFDLKPEKRLRISVGTKSTDVYTQNVVGILEGSDPVLKNEYVAVGAHYDHVGTNPFAAGEDKIWNGADDDGSGTVAVLAIAEAMAKGQRPKRSMLFIWHAGEEKGLWGSEYFSENPTVPISSIITELNIDMIGRYQNPGDENPQNKALPKQGEIFLIGSRMMSTELGDLSDGVNKGFLNLNYNFKYDDPNDPEQFFYRSDHFNYAKKGVPIIFYMDGSHADYHQVTDSIEKINFESMEKVTRTILATGWELANRATRPKVDKPLPASVTGGN
ncbi:MAG TPA: M20/M25/M40 family metallo-hydrolase [Pyrinomonadaceae bacterium]|nr:M20/M25/M40 family metallo-hydrolase [Pyrinomonadaceae bacterium]